MDTIVKQRLDRIDTLADTDPQHYNLEQKLLGLEPLFEKALSKLPEAEQDIIWTYLMDSRELSERKLVLACTHMRFLDEKAPSIAPRDRYDRLDALAEEAMPYRAWKASYESFTDAFTAYANAQPEDIRNFLWGYAESGRLMLQAKLSTALSHMEFIGEDT